MLKYFLCFLSSLIFLSNLSYSQNICATSVTGKYKEKVAAMFKSFYEQQGNLRARRQQLLNSSQPADVIKIKRRIVKAPDNNNELITTQDWYLALARLNEAFAPIFITFAYELQIDTVYNSNYYEFESGVDEGLFSVSNTANNLYHINLFVVKHVNGGSSGMSSLPPYYNTPDIQNEPSVPGNSILVNPIGMKSYSATFVHEMGHFFGLFHTFEDQFGQEKIDGSNSSFAGDFIRDTRANHHQKNKSQCSIISLQSCSSCYPVVRDCDNQEYTPDYDNYMSYFNNHCLNRFTPLQQDYMLKIKEEYRGYLYKDVWVQTVVDNNPISDTIFCDTNNISFRVVKKKNVQTVIWDFPGATPSSSNAESVTVNYSEFGSHSYSIMASHNSFPPYNSRLKTISIYDHTSLLKPLPIVANFENGLPAESEGWTFKNDNRDCEYFSSKFVGGFGNSNRSICMDNFTGINDDFDEFITPYFDITNLQSLKLDFDYAYASKINHFDTLYIGYLSCNGIYTIEKKGGDQLATHPPINNIQFVPLAYDWKKWNTIDLTFLLNNPSNKTLRIVFSVKSGNGNRLYIDNIRISGQPVSSTNGMAASFNRSNHKNQLSWPDFAADEDGYIIERSISEDGPWNEIGTVSENTTMFNEIVSTPNTTHWYRVKASNSTITIPYSNIDSANSCNIPNRPDPFNVSIPTGTSRTVNLNWSDNNTNETGYVVFYSFNRYGPYDTLVTLPANSINYQHTNTPLGNRIFYFVKAIEINFASLPSDTGLVNFTSLPSKTLSNIEWNIDGINSGWSSMNVSGYYAVERNFLVNLLGYSNGVHTLYIRATDNSGNQSNIYTQSFLRTIGDNGVNKILKFAYYFDDDNPPITNPVSPGTLSYDVSNIPGYDFTIPLNINALTDGIHTVHLRALDQFGNWSNVFSNTFLKLPGGGTKQITKIEYYIDSDPGFGLATDVPINAKNKIDTTLILGLTGISNGVHSFYLRAKDEHGLWSNIFSKSFIKLQGTSSKAITQIEYYYDADPGIGNGQHINFPTPQSNKDTIVTLNLTSLTDGIHTLYARAKDVKGMWSNIFGKSFLKMQGSGGTPTITKMEYYIDTDPGLGLANNIDTSGHSNGIYDLNIPLTAIADGEHILYIRAKDNKNLWSIIYSGMFHKVNEADCPCAKTVYGSGSATASSYQWQVDTGTGFQNIADTGVYFGTKLDSLIISNPPTSFAFNKYRCAITTGAGLTYSNTFVLRYNMSWTGKTDSTWNTMSNWGCYVLPDSKTDIKIPGGKPNYPLLNNDTSVNSIDLKPGSTIQVAAGVKLNILSRQQ